MDESEEEPSESEPSHKNLRLNLGRDISHRFGMTTIGVVNLVHLQPRFTRGYGKAWQYFVGQGHMVDTYFHYTTLLSQVQEPACAPELDLFIL